MLGLLNFLGVSLCLLELLVPYSFMFMLRAFVTLLTPVECIAIFQFFRSRSLFDEDPLRQIKKTLLADTALHESFGKELVAVLRWALPHGNFLFLEFMRMRCISLVTFHAEGEVVALGAIEAEHSFRDGLHALITAVPEVIPLV